MNEWMHSQFHFKSSSDEQKPNWARIHTRPFSRRPPSTWRCRACTHSYTLVYTVYICSAAHITCKHEEKYDRRWRKKACPVVFILHELRMCIQVLAVPMLQYHHMTWYNQKYAESETIFSSPNLSGNYTSCNRRLNINASWSSKQLGTNPQSAFLGRTLLPASFPV